MNTLFIDDYLARFSTMLARMDREAVNAAMERLERTWRQGRQILLLGNGGSALTALHLATDWSKGVYTATGVPLRARTLVDNMGLLTAYANDLSYDDVFVAQLKLLLEPDDVLVAISGSGNSENVVRAVAYARERGNDVIGLLGYQGGRLKDMVRYLVWSAVDDMQLTEDLHTLFGHMVMQKLGTAC